MKILSFPFLILLSNNKYMKYFWFLAILFSSGLNAQSSKSDWLIHSVPQKTTVREEDNTLVIKMDY